MLAILARWGGAETVGEFGLALAVCNPAMMMAYLQLGSVLAADAGQSYPLRTYLALRTTAAATALLVIGGAAIAVAPLYGIWPVILVLAIAKFLEAQSDIYQGVLKQADRMDAWAVAQVIRAAFSLACFTGLFYSTKSLVAAVGGLAGAWGVLLLMIDRPLALRYGVPSAMGGDRPWAAIAQMGRLARATFPLGVISLLITLYTYIPQYLLMAWHGSRDLGVFVVIASLPLVLETVVRSTGQAALPRLGRACQARDGATFWLLYRQTLGCFLCAGMLGLGLALLAGPFALEIAFSTCFADHANLLVWLTAAAAVSFLTSYGPVFLALRRYNVFLGLWVAGLAVLATLAWLLIPAYGVDGAAAAMIIANVVRCLAVHAAINYLGDQAFGRSDGRVSLDRAAIGHG